MYSKQLWLETQLGSFKNSIEQPSKFPQKRKSQIYHWYRSLYGLSIITSWSSYYCTVSIQTLLPDGRFEYYDSGLAFVTFSSTSVTIPI